MKDMISRILTFVKSLYKLTLTDKQWLDFYKKKGLKIGVNCRVYSFYFGSEPYLIKIGNHVTITAGVRFITHDGGAWVFRENEPDLEVAAPIVIGNNVFVGVNSIILPGTIIEDDIVIGANSVVKGHLKKGFVYAGVPIKKIKSIDDYRSSMNTRCEFKQSLNYAKKKEFYEKKFKETINNSCTST